MFFFLRLVYSAPDVCDTWVEESELISSRKNDTTLLKFSGSDYAKAEGKYGSQWTSESKQEFGQWIQFEFLKEKVKIEKYILRPDWRDDCYPADWVFEGSNDNKTFVQLDKVSSHSSFYFHCGKEFSITTSFYFHVFRLKFTAATSSSCDYVQLDLYSLNGTAEYEIFKPYTKKVKCTCKVRRGFLPSLSYLIPLIYTFVV